MTSDTAAAGAAADELAGLPPSPAVWCSGLRKRYGRQTAVDDVSFSVAAGEVLLLGRRSSDPRSRSAVGYLPELFRYQPWLTAAEVLDLHVRLARVPVPPAERLECLVLVGLADRADDRVG